MSRITSISTGRRGLLRGSLFGSVALGPVSEPIPTFRLSR